MTGDRRVRRPTIYTRLVADDYVRLTDCARAKGLTITAIARTAIREYLQRYEDRQESDRESKYAVQVQASTNRICSLPAKVAIDVRAMYRFLGELEDMQVQIEHCRAMAIHEISRRLTPGEKAVLDGMSKIVGGSGTPVEPKEIT